MKRVEKWVEQKIKNRQKHCLPAVLSGGPEGSRTLQEHILLCTVYIKYYTAKYKCCIFYTARIEYYTFKRVGKWVDNPGITPPDYLYEAIIA